MKHQLNNHAIVGRMQQACKVKNDAELARFLQETSSAISTWRKAKSPPFSACYSVAIRTGCNMEWLLHGDQPALSVKRKLGQVRFPNAYLERFSLLFTEYMEIASRIGLVTMNNDATKHELQRIGRSLYKEMQTSSSTGELGK